MQCYTLHNDLDQTFPGYTFRLAPGDEIIRGDYKKGIKSSLFMETAFDADWHFTDETRAALPRMNMFINMVSPNLPDLMGAYAAVPLRDETQGPIAISPRLREALDPVMGAAMDLVQPGALIDQLTGKKITDHGYMLLAVADERDTYDPAACKLSEHNRRDGRLIRSAKLITTHDATRIGDGVLWREAFDGGLRCSSRFKAIYDSIGGRGVTFNPTKMSGS